jgi:Ca2+-binding EF-hand superfamily protein
LKTRNNISEDEIQELQSSYSSYITSKNKKIFKEKVEKQVTPYNQNIPI